ncbi:hypothetical protein CfE428DRAFT_1344 [Chthoniobacter flavus Ellin428]|uniref:Uncharacterized protein n=1 Tax=Chthoniobacter flavus Ellin428 TaxID=497964 RepID=B4CXQ3_9BACT|nr:hypothetical protein CfE428DRAFT_1344 [Chthoniobacter flavus Ellin428]
MSQGGEENDDTHRKFETTDMREWDVPMPEMWHAAAVVVGTNRVVQIGA